MLPIHELAVAKGFLRQAQAFVSGVGSTFFDDGDGITAARLYDIANRIGDEVQRMEKIIRKRRLF
jgi:hypothetical protein